MQELRVVYLHLLLLDENVINNNIDRNFTAILGKPVLAEYPTFGLY